MAEYKSNHAMAPEAFRGWRLYMKNLHGWGIRECTEALGCGKNTVFDWSKRGAPLYIAIACQAIVDRTQPWTKVEDEVLRSS